jgi:hypothetical protein
LSDDLLDKPEEHQEFTRDSIECTIKSSFHCPSGWSHLNAPWPDSTMIRPGRASHIRDIPAFFELLPAQDQVGYQKLRAHVASTDRRYNRYRRVATMESILNDISIFCNRNDENDALRSLVCGIYWFRNGQIAINSLHLRILLGKSKSSINGVLAMMQYHPVTTNDEQRETLFAMFPPGRVEWADARQWTIRAPHTGMANAQDHFDLPQFDSDVENLFAPDDELVGFLRFRPNTSQSQESHGLGQAAGALEP